MGSKIAGKSDLERFGAPFGKDLGWSGHLLGASWPFFGDLESSFLQAWIQDGLQDVFWIDFGSSLEGLTMVLGWFGQRFGGFWGLGSTSGADFGHVCRDLVLLGQILS